MLCVTGPLCGESTGLSQKVSTAKHASMTWRRHVYIVYAGFTKPRDGNSIAHSTPTLMEIHTKSPKSSWSGNDEAQKKDMARSFAWSSVGNRSTSGIIHVWVIYKDKKQGGHS